jgi:hypothetical protein
VFPSVGAKPIAVLKYYLWFDLLDMKTVLPTFDL